ncbi:MAG: hypothetical protein FWD74_01825 [Actinomycetia bacterium]|nr:hypothetical protein [Actinomycetes bacterium]
MTANAAPATPAPEREWIEIEWVVLGADERADRLPADTAACPYVARARGLSVGPAEPGAPGMVETLANRVLRGAVTTTRPGYHHSFGLPNSAWIQMRDAIARARRGNV